MRRAKVRGTKRKYTEAQVQAVKQWKPLAQLCREIGVPPRLAQHIRSWNYKTQAPQ